MTTIHWKRFPFIRILPAFIFGLILGNYLILKVPILLIASLILALVITYLSRNFSPFRHFVLHIVLVAAGILLIQSRTSSKKAIIPMEVETLATLIELPVEKSKTYKAIVRLDYKNQLNQSETTKSIVYIRKDDEAKNLRVGDQFTATIKLKPIDGPELPGQFNYAKYMHQQGVDYTAFIESGKWDLTHTIDKRLFIKRWSSSQRLHLSRIIDEEIDKEAQGFVKAISLGERSSLDKEVRTSFSQVGIVHILAVSGLHVGIIYLLISLFLKPIASKNKYLQFTCFVIEIGSIWSFALITGFAPSVQRAAFMFSLFSIAKIFKLDKETLNITMASALCILVVQPNSIFSIGFQLSYAAVFAIVLLFPKIYKLFYFKNFLLDKIWQIQVVSLAAVIGTTPISLFHFQQFPIIFPISNLLAIPSAFLLVGSTVLLFICSPFHWLAHWIGFGISVFTKGLIQFTTFLAELPFSHVSNLYIDSFELIIIMLLIASISIAIYHVRLIKKTTFIFLSLLCILFFYRGIRKTLEYSNTETYSVNNNQTKYMNIGMKQFEIKIIEQEEIFRFDISGNHKHDMIYEREVIEIDVNKVSNFSKDHLKNNERFSDLNINLVP